jgi:hypothetical protein
MLLATHLRKWPLHPSTHSAAVAADAARQITLHSSSISENPSLGNLPYFELIAATALLFSHQA